MRGLPSRDRVLGTHVRDAFQSRVNAYRVRLTRGRDGAVIFVPPLPELGATVVYVRHRKDAYR